MYNVLCLLLEVVPVRIYLSSLYTEIYVENAFRATGTYLLLWLSTGKKITVCCLFFRLLLQQTTLANKTT